MQQSGSSTTTHWVSNATEWPPQTQAISRILSQEIPQVGKTPFVSPRCFPLLQEILRALLTEEGAEPANSKPVETPLLDVFNTILNTVVDIREVLNLDGYGDSHSSITFWSPFMSLLGRLCCEEASVLSDVTYILPRSDTEVERTEPRLDGIAHLLISYIATEPRQVPTPKAPDSAVSGSLAEEETHSEEDLDAMDSDMSFYSTSSQITTSDASVPEIDMPLSAHLLLGNGKRVNAVLPVISVADPDEVVLVLSSVLYQRYVWGIDAPAIAIATSRQGVSAHVVIGWIDHTLPVEGNNLPIVHIARPVDTLSVCSSIGAFDLTNALSVVNLAHFILSLRSHFVGIIKEASSPRVRHLSWRSDHIDIDDFLDKKSSEQTGSPISQWIAQTRLFTNPSEGPVLPRTPSPEPEPQELQMSYSTNEKLSPVTEEEQDGQSSPKASIVLHSKSEGSGVESVGLPRTKPKISTPQPLAKETHTSSSSWAAKSMSGGAEDSTGSTATWLSDRFCIRGTNTTHHPLPEDTFDDIEEKNLINTMINSYDNVTQFRWPEKWKKLDHLPPVDSIYADQRATLFTHYNQLRESVGDNLPELTEDEVQVVSQQFSTIFSASNGAFTLREAAKNCSVHEAESRHDWDALLYHFYVMPNQALSMNVLLERTLNYPRNPSADILKAEDLFKNRMALALETSAMCMRAAANLTGGYLQYIRRLIVRAEFEASEACQALEGANPHAIQLALKARDKREPPTGIVDAILVAPIQDTTRKSLPNTHRLVRRSPPKGASHTPSSASMVAGEKVTVGKTDLLSNPFQISCTETTMTGTPPIYFNSPLPAHHEDDLRLPVLLVEYKKPDDLPAKALNQCRMYCISAVTYLAALGIKERPVFGFATSGQVGFLIMVQFSSKRERIYLLERNTCSFDLSIPLQAFHFATCIIQMVKIGQKLQDVFKATHLSDAGQFGLDAATMEKLGSWTKSAQKQPLEGAKEE